MDMKKLMRSNFFRIEVIALIVSIVIGIVSIIFLRGSDLLYFILGIAFVIAGLPFFVFLIIEGRRGREQEEMFIEFSSNLVESVKAGTPISKSIVNVINKDYGSLNPYISKLANQISLGIPLQIALETFARDIGNKTVTRAVTIMGEAERAGGRIEDILESVVKSVTQISKLRKERMAAISGLVVQGYIIFLIFIVIMLIMQFQILPIASQLGGDLEGGEGANIGAGLGFVGGQAASAEELARPFFWLLLVQGFFAGLVIGKLSEGKIFSGLKHSFVLIVLSLLINTGAKAFLG